MLRIALGVVNAGRYCDIVAEPEDDRMVDVVYRSNVRIDTINGPVGNAFLPAEEKPVVFGVHDEIAAHYRVPAGASEPHAPTLDYVVAPAAG